MESKEALSIRSEHTLRSENLPFDIDVWYPLLKEHTFPTYFLPLSVKEARAILNMYQTSILRRKWLRPEDVDTLRNLEDRIGLLMNKHFQGKSAFMRLCGRSPKDADPLNHQQVMESYYSWMEKLVAEGYSTKDPNTHFMAFVKFNWMKVTTAVEVMNLLLTSERVHIDMDDWLRYGEPEQIVLREWEPELLIENEFRAFVFKNKLNAISQYDHYGVFPNLSKIKDRVQNKILDKWNEVHELIGEDSYVIDFGYLPEKDCVCVIELSPFLDCTGPACFRWSIPEDREILRNGPFEFRLNSVSKVTEGLVQAGIFDRFQNSTPNRRYWEWFEEVKPSKKSRCDLSDSEVFFSLFLSSFFSLFLLIF
eukprot:TRINITY_DN6143_c0_g1_i1.p1 TRINITY_DN6143_c0_g1~~TRINITY_DN6143_c0_g1_i1.p1  ORF type:complete len:391 (+),score=58.23 TRINITY_DN6143_c0_g1_i1:81-1175(+)